MPVLLLWSGLDHSTRGLRSVLLRGRMCLPSQLLHECHQSCYCANSGKSQTAPDDRHFHYNLHFLRGIVYASSNHRCTLSTLIRCPSPAVPQRSSMASQCSTLTTAPTSFSRSTATWWSEPVAVTNRSCPLLWARQIRRRDVLKKVGSEWTRDKEMIDWLVTRELLPQNKL